MAQATLEIRHMCGAYRIADFPAMIRQVWNPARCAVGNVLGFLLVHHAVFLRTPNTMTEVALTAFVTRSMVDGNPLSNA